ncbi:MAG: flagellar export protein FliJ [Desulfovibrionaceae bacterium]|nr:flagellar export protein FliJ [Desulfovibrionaceae bacterium]
MPGPFKFRMQKVLAYREQLEEQAKLALAQAIAAHADQEARVLDLADRLNAHLETGPVRSDQSRADPTPDDIWLWRRYREALEQDLARARARLDRLALKLQKCRREAVSRSRDRELLDKLKDKQARKHHEEQRLQEQKESDEMATLRHGTKDI